MGTLGNSFSIEAVEESGLPGELPANVIEVEVTRIFDGTSVVNKRKRGMKAALRLTVIPADFAASLVVGTVEYVLGPLALDVAPEESANLSETAHAFEKAEDVEDELAVFKASWQLVHSFIATIAKVILTRSRSGLLQVNLEIMQDDETWVYYYNPEVRPVRSAE